MPFFRDKTTALAIALAVATWALCLTFPRMDGDAAVYGNLAKHMVLQDDWVNLVFRGADWLDKPHLPFWLVALSFKLFGITARAYLVPGLVFYSLGAWCTYRLARHFYDQAVAALSSVVYLSLLGLLLGVSDQKAEVYLLGLMPGATLAWLKFSAAARWRAGWHYGLLGAVLTGCCLMTKGIFVVLVVAAGVVAPLVNRRDWAGLWHWKWLVAIVGSLLCAAPELVALYLQFDARPEAAAYGHTQVSGVKFFLWDSQFGRFFNTGPIQNSGGSPFFFLHNLVWTFFPWAVVLVCAGGTAVRRLWRGTGAGVPITLWATFFCAFALFSATKYQMDYYLIIVFPYAAIACAKWLVEVDVRRTLWRPLHLGFSVLLLALALVATGLSFWATSYAWTLLIFVPALAALWTPVDRLPWPRTVVYPVVAVACVFMFVLLNHYALYRTYNVGRQVAGYLNTQEKHPVYVHNMVFNTFDFFSDMPSLPVENAQALVDRLRAQTTTQHATGQTPASSPIAPFYLVTRASESAHLLASLNHLLITPALTARTLQTFEEIEIPKQFIKRLRKDDAALPHQALQVLRVSME